MFRNIVSSTGNVCIGFWSTLSPLGLNTEVYSENLCILSECGEIQTKNTPNKNTFYAVVEVSFVRT